MLDIQDTDAVDSAVGPQNPVDEPKPEPPSSIHR